MNTGRKRLATFPLRLPRSIKAELDRAARSDGISANQFIATAVAEKLAVMNTASYFARRKGRADLDAFLRILKRPGGQPPRTGDRLE